MTEPVDVPYSEFRRQIVQWIQDGRGSVKPAAVAQVLMENRINYPAQILSREIEVLARNDDWDNAHREILIAFPRHR